MFYIVSSALFFLYYGICLACLNTDRAAKVEAQAFRWRWKIVLGICTALSMGIVFWWIKQNKFIYYWDYSGYWTISIDRMKYMLENSVTKIISSLLESINNDDYNNFLPTVIAFPLRIVGYSFVRYICLLNVLFVIPAAFVQGKIATKIIKSEKLKRDTVFTIGCIVSLFFSGNYYALMCGYIDVAVLLPMSIAIYLLIDYDFSRFNLKKNIAISIMLVLIWISRRYTIYFIIGYVVTLFLDGVLKSVIDKKNYIINLIKNYIFIGVVSLSTLLILFPKFILKVLLTNYKDMYSAYDALMKDKILSLTSAFGRYSALIVLLTIFLCLIYKRRRKLIFCMIMMMTIECLSFWTTQAMGIQHKMILNVPMFIVYVLPLNFWNCLDVRKGWKYLSNIVVITAISLVGINYLCTFVPGISVKKGTQFFSEKYYPLQRNDIDNLKKLADVLKQQVDSTNEHIYVSASGGILNTDILRKLYMPYEYDTIPNLDPSCEVDLRDGFPTEFLHAKYIVTTDPIQVHLKSGQEVVKYLASKIQNETTYIGRHYQKIYEIKLDDGYAAKVYEKRSEYTQEDLEKIREHFEKMYPGHDEMFRRKIY